MIKDFLLILLLSYSNQVAICDINDQKSKDLKTNGDIYEGELMNGKRNGFGKSTWDLVEGR